MWRIEAFRTGGERSVAGWPRVQAGPRGRILPPYTFQNGAVPRLDKSPVPQNTYHTSGLTRAQANLTWLFADYADSYGTNIAHCIRANVRALLIKILNCPISCAQFHSYYSCIMRLLRPVAQRLCPASRTGPRNRTAAILQSSPFPESVLQPLSVPVCLIRRIL